MQASTEETQKELERLHNQVHQLQEELQRKSDKIVGSEQDFRDRRDRAKVIGNRNLPLSADWLTF